jgi:hypothetical protein
MFVNKNKIKGCGLSAMSDISHGINQWYDRDDFKTIDIDTF